MSMSIKKIILILVVITVVGLGAYYVLFFRGSITEARLMVPKNDNPASQIYTAFEGEKCGISLTKDDERGLANDTIESCLKEKYDTCTAAVTLYYNKQGNTEEYATIRILGRDDAGDCSLQNTFHKVIDGTAVEQWTSSCSSLDQENIITTCKPSFIK